MTGKVFFGRKKKEGESGEIVGATTISFWFIDIARVPLL
jgi:hypothetical protein